MRPDDQLPSIRRLAEELVIKPNTVAKAYREIEREGVVEIRQGAGAFIANTARAPPGGERFRSAQPLVADPVERLRARGLSDEEIRRLFEAELAGVGKAEVRGG